MNRLTLSSFAAGFSAWVVLAASSPATAGFMNGNELWDDLRAAQRIDGGKNSESDYLPAARGIGYVTGVVDALGGSSFCLPDKITVGQIKDIASNWLRDHPDKRHYQAELLVRDAFAEKFPCIRPPVR